MAHFAEVIDGVVTRVLVIEQDMVDTGKFGNPENFIKTSINTHGGVHSLGGTPLRRNYATVGGTYDSETDEFIPEKPTPSCVLVRTDGGDWWMPPKPYPFEIVGGKFEWKEDIQEWVDVG